MPRIKYVSDSFEQQSTSSAARSHFGRQKPLHELLGGGKVADVLLWRNKHLSAAILAGATLIWLLFEVVEYPFITLLCHISIVAMLVAFIWSNGARLFDRSPPQIPEVVLSEADIKRVALAFQSQFNHFISILHDIACGKDLKTFLLAIASLLMLSVVGSYCSSTSLLYLCFLCVDTLPALYETYEVEVNHLLASASGDLRKFFEELDSKVLKKIPRGPVKEKKLK